MAQLDLYHMFAAMLDSRRSYQKGNGQRLSIRGPRRSSLRPQSGGTWPALPHTAGKTILMVGGAPSRKWARPRDALAAQSFDPTPPPFAAESHLRRCTGRAWFFDPPWAEIKPRVGPHVRCDSWKVVRPCQRPQVQAQQPLRESLSRAVHCSGVVRAGRPPAAAPAGCSMTEKSITPPIAVPGCYTQGRNAWMSSATPEIGAGHERERRDGRKRRRPGTARR